VKEIVFISQKKQAVEVHRRNADGQFVIQDYGAELYRALVQYRALSAS